MKMLVLAHWKSAMAILIELLEDILEMSGPPKWPCYNLAIDYIDYCYALLLDHQNSCFTCVIISLGASCLSISFWCFHICFKILQIWFSHMCVRTWVGLIALQKWNAILTSSSKGWKYPRYQISYIWNAQLESFSKGSKCPRHQISYIQGEYGEWIWGYPLLSIPGKTRNLIMSLSLYAWEW